VRKTANEAGNKAARDGGRVAGTNERRTSYVIYFLSLVAGPVVVLFAGATEAYSRATGRFKVQPQEVYLRVNLTPE
jgi:hypothetical protein